MIAGRTAQQSERALVQVDAEIEDLVPIFLENRREDIRGMLTALDQGDYETIQSFGHNMKGVGGSYGFDFITEIGGLLEQGAKVRHSAEIRELVLELSTYLEHVEVVCV